MKYLFKITEKTIKTLVLGRDFLMKDSKILFANGETIYFNKLDTILVNAKCGYVAFTSDVANCVKLQSKIQDIYEGSDDLCQAEQTS